MPFNKKLEWLLFLNPSSLVNILLSHLCGNYMFCNFWLYSKFAGSAFDHYWNLGLRLESLDGLAGLQNHNGIVTKNIFKNMNSGKYNRKIQNKKNIEVNKTKLMKK